MTLRSSLHLHPCRMVSHYVGVGGDLCHRDCLTACLQQQQQEKGMGDGEGDGHDGMYIHQPAGVLKRGKRG